MRRFLSGLGALLGRCAYALGVRRKVALEGLARAFPELEDKARRRIARRSYAQLGRGLLEIFAPPSNEALGRLFFFDGWELWERANAKGRGVVVAIAHYGNWELLARASAQRGVALTAITRRLRGAFNERLVATRRASGWKELPEKSSTRQAVELLRRGETLAIVVDQNMRPQRGIFVDFFGTQACTTPAAAVLSLRTGAPLLAAFPVRQPDGTHRAHFVGPFETSARGHAAVVELTQLLTKAVERAVREHPDHWFWVHRRWKTRP